MQASRYETIVRSIVLFLLVAIGFGSACAPLKSTTDAPGSLALESVNYEEITTRSNSAAGSYTGSCAPFSTRGWRWSVEDRVRQRQDSCLIEQANVIFDRIFREYSEQSLVLSCQGEQALYESAVQSMNDLWNQVHPQFQRVPGSYNSQVQYFNMRLQSFANVHSSRQSNCSQVSSEPVQITSRAAYWQDGVMTLEFRGSGLDRVTRTSSGTITMKDSGVIIISWPSFTGGPAATGIEFYQLDVRIGVQYFLIPAQGMQPSIDQVDRVGQDADGILFRAWGNLFESIAAIESDCGPVSVISTGSVVDLRVNAGTRPLCDFTFRFLRGAESRINDVATGINPPPPPQAPAPQILVSTPGQVVASESRSYATLKGVNFSENGNNVVVSSNCAVEKVYDGADGAGAATGMRQINVRVPAQPQAFSCRFRVRIPDGQESNEVSVTMPFLPPAQVPAPVIQQSLPQQAVASENRSYATLKGTGFSANGDNTVMSSNCTVEKTYDGVDGAGAGSGLRQINVRVPAQSQAFSCNFQVRRPDGQVSNQVSVNMPFLTPAPAPAAPMITQTIPGQAVASEGRSYATLKGTNFSVNGDNTVVSPNCSVEKTYDGVDGAGAIGLRQINVRVPAQNQAFSCTFQVRRPDLSLSPAVTVAMPFLASAPAPVIQSATAGQAVASEGRSYATLKGTNFSMNGDNIVTSPNCSVEKTYDGVDGAGATGLRQINVRVPTQNQAFSCTFVVRRPDGVSSSPAYVLMAFLPPASQATCGVTPSVTRVANGPNTRGLPTMVTFARNGTAQGTFYWGVNGASLVMQLGLENPGSSIALPYDGIPAGVYTVTSEIRPSGGGAIPCGSFTLTVENP